jgi:hypothetical protein
MNVARLDVDEETFRRVYEKLANFEEIRRCSERRNMLHAEPDAELGVGRQHLH